jgi:hypothetical protein
MTNLSPVVLFVYNRPQHTQACLDALAKNDLATETDLFVFSDAPKNEQDWDKVNEVRRLFRQNLPFKNIYLFEATENKGLMTSIIEGVTKIVNQYEKIIVLEDDLITSKGFLAYMNDALNFYENVPQVMHISGYMFPIQKKLPHETVFYQSTSCWSWATWKNRWQFFNPDATDLYQKLIATNKMFRFDLDDSNQFKSQLEMNITGKRYTWAIKWEASVHLQGGLCLHPTQTMVRNIGHEGSGNSFDKSGLLATQSLRNYTKVEPIPLQESQTLREAMKLYYALDGDMRKRKQFLYYLKKYTFHKLPKTWKNKIRSIASF